MRKVSWFSCGAASAVATKLSKPDVIAYCETGSEDADNKRFMSDCEKWFDQEILILKNPDFDSTWDVWEKKKYISGISGAPCTGELKVKPRLAFQEPDDIHIFGYTSDASDIRRAFALNENYPDLKTEYPLIEKGLNKANCLAMLQTVGIEPPRVYKMGYPNANCIPCCKATSPNYWAMVRNNHPDEFWRMAYLSRDLNVKLTRIKGERCFIDEIPDDWPMTEPLAPECDFLCQAVEQELTEEK